MLANALAALAAHSIVGSNLGTARRDIATIALQAESDDWQRRPAGAGAASRSGSRMWTSGFLPEPPLWPAFDLPAAPAGPAVIDDDIDFDDDLPRPE